MPSSSPGSLTVVAQRSRVAEALRELSNQFSVLLAARILLEQFQEMRSADHALFAFGRFR